MIHTVQCKSRGDAEKRARDAGAGSSRVNGAHVPEHHQAHKAGQQAHYHPTNAQGEKDFGAAHYNYGPKKPEEKKQQEKK
jgi:hypothetical protein